MKLQLVNTETMGKPAGKFPVAWALVGILALALGGFVVFFLSQRGGSGDGQAANTGSQPSQGVAPGGDIGQISVSNLGRDDGRKEKLTAKAASDWPKELVLEATLTQPDANNVLLIYAITAKQKSKIGGVVFIADGQQIGQSFSFGPSGRTLEPGQKVADKEGFGAYALSGVKTLEIKVLNFQVLGPAPTAVPKPTTATVAPTKSGSWTQVFETEKGTVEVIYIQTAFAAERNLAVKIVVENGFMNAYATNNSSSALQEGTASWIYTEWNAKREMINTAHPPIRAGTGSTVIGPKSTSGSSDVGGSPGATKMELKIEAR